MVHVSSDDDQRSLLRSMTNPMGSHCPSWGVLISSQLFTHGLFVCCSLRFFQGKNSNRSSINKIINRRSWDFSEGGGEGKWSVHCLLFKILHRNQRKKEKKNANNHRWEGVFEGVTFCVLSTTAIQREGVNWSGLWVLWIERAWPLFGATGPLRCACTWRPN